MKNAEYVISKSSLEMYANFYWHKHVPMQINKDLIFMKFIWNWETSYVSLELTVILKYMYMLYITTSCRHFYYFNGQSVVYNDCGYKEYFNCKRSINKIDWCYFFLKRNNQQVNGIKKCHCFLKNCHVYNLFLTVSVKNAFICHISLMYKSDIFSLLEFILS